MKSSKLVLALWLGASSWAQTLPLKPQVNPAVSARPSAARPAAPSARSPKTASVPSAKAGPVATPQSARVQSRPASVKQVSWRDRGNGRRNYVDRPVFAKAAKHQGGTPEPWGSGRRDPFVSPIVEHLRDSGTCAGGGRRCLLVGEISLHGVVRTSAGFIAVVVNGDHTYFLHENDPLANGSVERITTDAITLRERSSDALGRPFTHEVTKKLGVPAV